MLLNTPACKGCQELDATIASEGVQVAKEVHEFSKHDVIIVRSQWTKTQGGYSIRVNNYFSEKRHFLQVPLDNLKQCRQVIAELKEKGEFQFWTGHHVKVN